MAGSVEILEGNTFLVSDERGDVDGSPVEAHGLFDRETRFQEILFAARQISPASTLGEHASIGFDLSEAGQYRLVADDGRLSLDARADEADCVLATDAPTLVELLRGDRNPTTTIYSGRARLTGDVQLATRLLGFLWRQGVGPQ